MFQWDLEVRWARVDDVDLAYMEIGEGPPLLLLMGIWGSMDLWPPGLVQGLAEENRVIMFDYRGIAHSTSSSKQFSYDLFSDDAAGLLDALKLERASLLGWSMGANVALVTAIRHPRRVGKLVVYSGRPYPRHHVPPAPELQELYSRHRFTAEELTKSMFPPSWNEDHPDIWEYLPKVRRKSSREVIERQRVVAEEWKGCNDGLSSIRAPTLVITGDEDLDTPRECSFDIAERIEGAWLMQFPGGHGLMYQYPRELALVVNTFLRNR